MPTAPRWVDRSASLPAHLPLNERLLLLRDLPPGHERDLFLLRDAHRHVRDLLGDPLTLPDMPVAVDRVLRAVGRGEKMRVCGDYDADGVTATAILVRGLRGLGANIDYSIPYRVDEGFGLNERAVRTAADDGCTLIITVDNGTSDVREVELARSLGVDVIISDHHALGPELPEAVAVINPHRNVGSYPDRHLSGAGLAYAFLRAVVYAAGAAPTIRATEYLQLAALGTIADVAPLRGENRLLVRAGLVALNRAPIPGVAALLRTSGLTGYAVSEADISYKLAPRINAAGRMHHASIACDLLLETDAARAAALADQLETMNEQRRAETDLMLEHASAGLAIDGQGAEGDVLTVYGEDWSPALLGILAGRLSRQHGVPVVAATRDDTGVRASARSLPGLDITSALGGCAELLTHYGGHEQAAGFSTSHAALPEVHRHLSEVFRGTRREQMLQVDAELAPADISPDLGDFLLQLAPFGSANPEPLFGLRGVLPLDARSFGRDRNHLSVRLPGARGEVEAIAFYKADIRNEISSGERRDLVVRPLRQRDGTYQPLKFHIEEIFPTS